MIYNINYDIAGLISALFLLLVYWLRKTYKTKSSRLIIGLLVCDALGCLFDIASCKSITLPGKFPMWYNNFTTLGYLFFYNYMGVLFFAYIDSKTKIKCLWKPIKVIIPVLTVFYAVVIATSPFTHLISYFDSNMTYTHGPLMPLLYVMAAALFLVSFILFFIKRKRFNRYQVYAVLSFIGAVFLGEYIQMIKPTLLVGQFGCTLVIFFLYTSFENPAYFTFRQTPCYNRNAFLQTMKYKQRNKEKVNIFAFAIRDYDNLKESLSLKNCNRVSSKVADYISTYFHQNAYCITEDKFVVLLDKEEDEYKVIKRLEKFSQNEIELVDVTVNISFKHIFVCGIDADIKTDVIESAITNILEKDGDGLGIDFEFDSVIKDMERQKKISKILKDAIKNESFNVYYQPIRDVESGKFTSVEALVRLGNSDIGFISPEEFIPLAENQGMIFRIGEIVFEKVCKFIRDSDCINSLGVHYIEINLSPLQCFQKDIVKIFTEIMKKYEVDPHWINLEITETAAFETDDIMSLNIEAFHNMGVSFSLDDYGSGFASADYLFKLPVEIVKIDKGILWNAMKDKNAKIVLVSTLKMLKDLGKRIVVEGVEDEEMVALLEANGCDYMQGYLYSKPIPPKEYIQFLDEHNR